MCQQHICDAVHQWELEQKKTEDVEGAKVDKNNWAKTMENIVLHFKLIRGMRGFLLANVVWCHIKVAHISPWYGAYLNLDEKMIARLPLLTLGWTSSQIRILWTGSIWTTSVIHSRLTMPLLIKFSQRCSQTQKLISIWNRENECRMVKQCPLMSISDFLALTMWPGRA